MSSAMIVILSSTVLVSVVNLIGGVISWVLSRRAKKQDDQAADRDKQIASMLEQIEALMKCQKVTAQDRIRYLCKKYILQGWIDVDDIGDLWELHNAYHDLNGNGKLDHLMEEVNRLPRNKGGAA